MNRVEGLDPDSAPISSRSEILEELARRIDAQVPTLVFVSKLARLKPFNHAFGVAMGDQLLQAMANRMIEVAGTRRQAGILRSGLFIVLIDPGPTTTEVRSEEIIGAMTETLHLGGVEHRPELRVGVAYAEPGRSDVDQLLIEASAAMRSAASTDRTVVIVDDRIRRKARATAIVERDLEASLASGELSFAYQPLVTLHDGVVHGAEALLRWNHPELGELEPSEVIARIQAVGMTSQFTEWTLDRVASEWATVVGPESDLQGASVSINLHVDQLASPLIAPMLERVLDRHGLEPQSIVIEVVETAPIGIGEAAAKTLRAIAEIGCPVVLDDFGTGFSALEYFLEFPVTGIKFDRSLIVSMRSNETARVIVKGIARIADELGVLTVAEGIETAADAANCRDVPLTLGQGWHHGYPLTLDEFVKHAVESRRGISPEALRRETFDQKPPTP